MEIPSPPKNSCIHVKTQADGITLSWKRTGAGPQRVIVLLFLGFVLFGWSNQVIRHFRLGGPRVPELEVFFLLFGAVAVVMFYLVIRPQ